MAVCVLSVPRATAQDEGSRAAKVGSFLLGGGAAFGLHEAGHLVLNAALGVSPDVKAVRFGPIPFFAISHPSNLTPRKEFAIASAGFWMQSLSSEVVLTRRPDIGRQRAPFGKGILAFNVLASFAYGAAAMARAGPAERDTRGMAEALGVSERWIGVLVVAPAALDAWRYFHPGSAWAAWLSRGVKVGSVLLVLGARE